jgi:hypothetical protein
LENCGASPVAQICSSVLSYLVAPQRTRNQSSWDFQPRE